MVRLGWVLAALLMHGTLAGCLGSGATDDVDAAGVGPTALRPWPPGTPEPVVGPILLLEDVAGDAMEWNSDAARQQPYVMAACNGLAAETGQGVCDAAPAWGVGGAPAPPFLDGTAVRITETPSELVVELELAEMPADPMDLVDAERDLGARYFVRWSADGSVECAETVRFIVYPVGGGLELDRADYWYRWTDCPGDSATDAPWEGGCASDVGPTLGACNRPVRLELRPGTRGAVVWRIPRELMRDAGPGATLPAPSFSIGRWVGQGTTYASAVWTPPSAADPVGRPDAIVDADIRYAVDVGGPGAEHVFSTPIARVADVHVGEGAWLDHELGHPPERPRPQTDVTSIELVESPERLSFVATLLQLDEEPGEGDPNHEADDTEFLLSIFFELPSGDQYAVALGAEDGAYRSSASRQVYDEEAAAIVAELVPVEAVLAPGAPGAVTFILERALLPPIPAGSMLRELTANVNPRFDETTGLPGAGSVFTYVRRETYEDVRTDVPYVFRYASAPAPEAPTASVLDARGDVVRPVDSNVDVDVHNARFDITAVEAKLVARDRIQLKLSVGDLRATDVPRPYDALFYGIAVPTPEHTVMFGLFRSADDPAARYFCAEDVTVLAPIPQHPQTSTWTPIEGIISSAAGVATEEAGAAAGGHALTLTAPLSCFGPEASGEVQTVGLAAGTYLLRSGDATVPTSVAVLDHADDNEARLLTFTEVVVPVPVWERGSFWDILGAVLALVTILGTAIIVWHRRHRFKTYIHRIDKAVAAHADDAEGLARALAAVSSDLERDLRKGRLPTDHYGVVQTRLRHERLMVRVDIFATEFRDLPIGLAKDLERYLLDGVLSREDRVRVLATARQHRVPPRMVKDLERMLDRWVGEDVSRGGA